ncbi:MAG: DUF3800 domain-containing protein [Anaerolineae bacterium]|nr:DUF3800 domain-containing protein [Anaerolineae bacterium]
MSASFVVYIDESGDEGFSFAKGSSEWFVLSAVVTVKSTDLMVVKLVDRVRNVLQKPPKKPLHFRDLKHHQRVPYIDQISKASLRIVSVIVHKPSIREPETFQERYRLYFYSVRLLLERVSWYCRDFRPESDDGDGSAEIIFSNRSGMSYAEICKYLDLLKSSPYDVRIDWGAVKSSQIKAYSSGRRMGLQIADAVASGFFYAVEKTSYGFTEDRYARQLKPVVYNRKGKYQGYGLKIWPPGTSNGEDLQWLREMYK